MAPAKRPCDRKSQWFKMRLTKGERAALKRKCVAGESMSDAVRRLVFGTTDSTAPAWSSKAS